MYGEYLSFVSLILSLPGGVYFGSGDKLTVLEGAPPRVPAPPTLNCVNCGAPHEGLRACGWCGTRLE